LGLHFGPILPDATKVPKLFVDHGRHGDSDKPKDYAYSTAERTDLVEAIWRDLSVESTTLVAFDFSSLVVLEHPRPRISHLKP
jgi:pimeloyl-ACP methyl ester carboxylesterase